MIFHGIDVLSLLCLFYPEQTNWLLLGSGSKELLECRAKYLQDRHPLVNEALVALLDRVCARVNVYPLDSDSSLALPDWARLRAGAAASLHASADASTVDRSHTHFTPD